MTHAISYDLIGADDGEHNRMRTEVMKKIPGAKKRLDTLWTVPTNNRTSAQIYDNVIARIRRKKIKADEIDLWVAKRTNPEQETKKLR